MEWHYKVWAGLRFSVSLSADDEDGMDAADNERRPHFPQFSYSASGREWALQPSQPVSSPFVAILRKTRSHFRKKKKYQSPLFFSFSASSQTRRSLFRDFKRGFCTVGQTPAGLPTLKNKSPTFSALFTAEGNVFVIYFFLSVSIKLSTRVAFLFFFFFVVSALLLLLTFLHLVWTSRFREQKNQKCCLTCADVSYHTDRVLFWERAGGLRGCEGSFLVKSKCMACGSLKKKKKKMSFSYICHGGAHSPIPWRWKSLSKKEK